MASFRARFRVSIGTLIAALLLALVLPLLAFFGYLMADLADERRGLVEADGSEALSLVNGAMQQRLGSMATVLAVLGGSGWIEAGEYDRLHRRASTALARSGQYLIVLDEAFNQVLNTRVPFGSDLGKTANVAAARHVLETGAASVSDVFLGGVAQTQVFNVMRRYRPDAGPDRVLILTSNTSELRTLVDPASMPKAWHYAVIDGKGAIVVTTIADPADMPAGCKTGVGEADIGDGFLATERVPGTRWKVCVWLPVEAAARLGTGLPRSFAVLSALALAAAVAGALAMGSLIAREIARAARTGLAFETGAGEPGAVPRGSSPITEVDALLGVLDRAARSRRAKDEELWLLLHETAHRAKNQIAVATALVRLSARQAPDVARLRDDLVERFGTLARSVDSIVGRDWQSVALSELVRVQLAPFVAPGSGRLETGGDEIRISQTAAQSLGLVLHELATNATKHGAWSGPEGRVAVRWTVSNEELGIEWRESGGPTPDGPGDAGFGSTLLDALVSRSFRGRLERDFGPDGLACRLHLPIDAVLETPPAIDAERAEVG